MIAGAKFIHNGKQLETNDLREGNDNTSKQKYQGFALISVQSWNFKDGGS